MRSKLTFNFLSASFLLASSVYLLGCSPGLETTSYKTTDLPANLNPFSEKKVVVDFARLGQADSRYTGQEGNTESSSTSLLAETKWIAVFNNTCLDENPKQEISSQSWAISSTTKKPELQLQAYNLTLTREIKLSELENWGDSNPCLVGLSEDPGKAISSWTPNDPIYGAQSGLHDIGYDKALEILYRPDGINGTHLIGIADEGAVNTSHPDAQNQFTADSFVGPGVGHGHYVAGIIMSKTNNSAGISGIMGKNAVARYTQFGTFENVINELLELKRRKAVVFNASIALGSGLPLTHYPPFLLAANEAARGGVVVVLAGGNLSANVAKVNSDSGVIVVGAMDGITSVAGYSSRGEGVNLFGPAYGIYGYAGSDGYQSWGGTSTSAPVVAGSAALISSYLRSRSPASIPSAAQVTKILTDSADVVNSNVGVIKRLNLHRAAVLASSSTFDPEVYLARYPDVKAGIESGRIASAYSHYMNIGYLQGRTSYFDETFYLATHSDVKKAITNGILSSGRQHYLSYGSRENRISVFNEDMYLTLNPDVRAEVAKGTFENGRSHYLKFGYSDPRILDFDEEFYLAANSDVRTGINNGQFMSGLAHYLKHGFSEGRPGLFNEWRYLQLYPDAKAAVAAGSIETGRLHYIRYGSIEGRPL